MPSSSRILTVLRGGQNSVITDGQFSVVISNAEAIQKIFIEKFNFSAENIITLVDEAATRSAMDEVFLTLRVKINSR